MNELTKQEYDRILKTNTSVKEEVESMERVFKRAKSEILKKENKEVFQCAICKKYFEGEGHKPKTDDMCDAGGIFARVCDNCTDYEIESLALYVPTQKERDDHQDYNYENRCNDWFNFKWLVYTNRGEFAQRYDVLKFKDAKTKEDILSIDFAGDSFRINVRKGKIKHNTYKFGDTKIGEFLIEKEDEQ
jgi:hypothetical protein